MNERNSLTPLGNEIMKNTSGRDIAVGDEIRVLENQFTYEDDENTRVLAILTNIR